MVNEREIWLEARNIFDIVEPTIVYSDLTVTGS